MKWGVAFILLLAAGRPAGAEDLAKVSVPVLAEPLLTFETPEIETVYSDAMKERDETLARRFVQSALRPASSFEDQYAKWTVPVCPHVYGLSPGANFVIERRIRDIARQVGAPVDAEACIHNISVIVTPDPQATLDSIAGAAPWLLNGAPMKDLKIHAPVQAWYAAMAADYGGRLRAHPDWEDYADRPPVVQAGNSRLFTGVHPFMGAITVLVDAHAVMGLQLGTLGDYVAMMTLIQTRNNDACQPAPSIANLLLDKCEAGIHVSRLSEADRALMTAVYRTPLEPEMIQKPRIVGNMRKLLEVAFYAKQN